MVVARRDPARLPHQIEDREIGNCGPERQATTLKRDRARLRRELQLVGQPRLAEAGIAGNADDLSLRGRGAKGLPQRLELLISSREGSELLVCLVDRGRARAAPDDAQRVDGALVDRHRLCLLKIEVTTQVGRGRGTHQHISGASRPMQTSCKHSRVTGGGVIHPKVVADGAHDDRTGVDPDPDVDLGSLLDGECGKRGAACVVMVEKSRRVCEALRRNAELLAAKNLQLHCADALEFATAAAADAFRNSRREGRVTWRAGLPRPASRCTTGSRGNAAPPRPDGPR